jgi:hypothetical protein
MKVRFGFCTAARGTTMPRTAGRPTAAGTTLAAGAAASGFGLSAFQVSLVSRAGQARGMRSAESIDPSERSRRDGVGVGWGVSIEHGSSRHVRQ